MSWHGLNLILKQSTRGLRFNSIQLTEIDSYCFRLLQLGKLAKIRLDQMANKLPIKPMDSKQSEKNYTMKNTGKFNKGFAVLGSFGQLSWCFSLFWPKTDLQTIQTKIFHFSKKLLRYQMIREKYLFEKKVLAKCPKKSIWQLSPVKKNFTPIRKNNSCTYLKVS